MKYLIAMLVVAVSSLSVAKEKPPTYLCLSYLDENKEWVVSKAKFATDKECYAAGAKTVGLLLENGFTIQESTVVDSRMECHTPERHEPCEFF